MNKLKPCPFCGGKATAYDKAVQDGRLVDWCVRLRRGVERAISDYQREPTIEHADRLAGVIDEFIRDN